MGQLIDQFCDAIREWSAHTGGSDFEPVFFGMLYTGGSYFYPQVGGVDPATLPKERRRSASSSEIGGRHTLEQLRERIDVLVTQQGLHEEFLVVEWVRHWFTNSMIRRAC